ncbi:MAG: alanine racemase [bacterium]|nr:alanine racemase [bacterium]
MPFSRAIWVEVSKSALANNISEIQKRAGDQEIIAVVKANAYGHGLVGTSKALKEIGIREFAVASVGEGLELRHSGIGQRSSKILVLGYSLPTHAEEVIRSGLCQTVISAHEIRALADASRKLEKPAHIQIKIDTGMHRLGAPAGDFGRLMDALKHYPSVKLDGIYTHFSSADEPENPITKIQFDTFKKALAPYKLPKRVKLHASNSSALINFPRFKLDKVRPGIAIYGEYASPNVPKRLKLIPALSLKSRIVEIKTIGSGHGAGYNRRFVNESSVPCRLGIIPVGYADGFMTRSSGRREVLVRGRRSRVIGAVSMDFAHILLPDDLSIGVGEPVTLIGSDGKDSITASELGVVLGTHAYEVLCLIPTRIPRKYVE